MSHPDSAWSPYYVGPVGIGEDEPCLHVSTRMSVGPNSRKRRFWIQSDNCLRCGRILRSARDLSWREYDWVRRWNNSR